MFKFSLQTVLDVRVRFEKIKYKEYTTELLAYQKIENQCAAVESKREQARQNAESAKHSSPSPVPFMMNESYQKRLKGDLVRLRQKLNEQKEAVDLKRKELVEARRSHKALEILKEKEISRYRQSMERRERAVMDEIAANYHNFHH
ncbi:MAG: flagellar export protein FliJ [Deltaproteobacteria bacterium]|nr:flagellar export protein FliJ [Deltaproteobacteria bacterium]